MIDIDHSLLDLTSYRYNTVFDGPGCFDQFIFDVHCRILEDLGIQEVAANLDSLLADTDRRLSDVFGTIDDFATDVFAGVDSRAGCTGSGIVARAEDAAEHAAQSAQKTRLDTRFHDRCSSRTACVRRKGAAAFLPAAIVSKNLDIQFGEECINSRQAEDKKRPSGV